MCAVPAIVAKVPEIVLVSPPNKDGFINPFILATANMLGIKEVYKVGGAQAIAALAYGTKTIKKVDKIVGPGNEYVTEAKRQVFGHVGIDMLAGPSEIAIVADKDSNLAYILADLRSQTEHRGGLGVVVIIGDTITKELAKHDIENAFIVPAKDEDEAAAIVNEFAPEHLELMQSGARGFTKKIVNAGAIFVNELTPVPLGDYIAGPSHVLPTSTTARFSSGLSCFDFLKRLHVVEYSKKALQEDAEAFKQICGIENMPMHRDSVLVRLK
jgi:histidinol dehydrogenase